MLYFLFLGLSLAGAQEHYEKALGIGLQNETLVVALPEVEEVKEKEAGMGLIPAGEFWMGCNKRIDQECEDAGPGRMVYLDAFYLGRYEVTVAEYDRCVQAGKCSSRGLTQYSKCNWGRGGQDDHPINCVDWYQAQAYCEWAGKRLPTEAEWEKAARGEDGREYPWGNQWDSSKANAGGKVGRTVSVGSYSSGASPYGIHDMAGNVWEWVADWYDGTYYRRSPSRNPKGPDSGSLKVLRSGSWGSHPRLAQVFFRLSYVPRGRSTYVGIRCAQ